MRRVRFAADGRVRNGVAVEDDSVLIDESGRSYGANSVVWLPPVVPGKVVGLALNYADHAEELGMSSPEEPALFFKPLSSLVGHRGTVIAPGGVDYMHYEVELAVVIGSVARRVRAQNALEHVRGYTIANDVTIRDFVHNFYRPPVKAKGWDTFGPLGPCLVEGEIDDPSNLELRAFVNGELRQTGHTSMLLRDVGALIEYITEFMTLEPDDVVLTGTPKGISHVYPGDVMRLEVDGLGALENPIVLAEA